MTIHSGKFMTMGDTITDRGLHETAKSNSRFFDTMGNTNAFTPAPVRTRNGDMTLPELNSGVLDQAARYSRK